MSLMSMLARMGCRVGLMAFAFSIVLLLADWRSLKVSAVLTTKVQTLKSVSLRTS